MLQHLLGTLTHARESAGTRRPARGHLRVLVAALCVCGCLAALPAATAADEAGACFLKNGDRWLFVGDSITNTDTYRQVLLRVLQHYHPGADILVGNSAVNGVTSDYKEKREFTPTVVTIMLGMNDIIHQDYAFTPDMTEKLNAYRAAMTQKVRDYKKLGATVILMTPTYTDERFSAFFNVATTRRFLEAFGKVIREVAAAEQCEWLPVAEEMEAFQDAQPADRQFRPDGVHPYGLGQYQIARTLWQHLNFAGTLKGERRMITPAAALPVTMRLANRFMHDPADGVTLELTSSAKLDVVARWSLGDARGEAKLSVGPDAATTWKPELPAAALTVPLGEQRKLVVDLTSAGATRLCIIDLGHTRVLKLDKGSASGEIRSKDDRPEGKLVARWKLEELGNDLCFSGEVMDSEIAKDSGWPFMRDGIQLWLDLRPAARFADINPDRDVADVLVTAAEKPLFCLTPVAWISPRLMYATAVGGARTATGYTWHCTIGGKVSDARSYGTAGLDYYSFNMIICDNDTLAQPGTHYYPLQETICKDPIESLNRQLIVDRKGKFPKAETTTLHLFQ